MMHLDGANNLLPNFNPNSSIGCPFRTLIWISGLEIGKEAAGLM